MSKHDWNALVKAFHPLGIWYAMSYLKASAVRDPSSMAQDVVQEAWLTLWERGTFSKGAFIGIICDRSIDAIRDARPIDVSRGVPVPQRRYGKGLRRKSRLTDTFPVQVFGGMLGEVTIREDVIEPSCGDE